MFSVHEPSLPQHDNSLQYLTLLTLVLPTSTARTASLCMFMSIKGSAKFIYAYWQVLVMRIKVDQIWGIFMGIKCTSMSPLPHWDWPLPSKQDRAHSLPTFIHYNILFFLIFRNLTHFLYTLNITPARKGMYIAQWSVAEKRRKNITKTLNLDHRNRERGSVTPWQGNKNIGWFISHYDFRMKRDSLESFFSSRPAGLWHKATETQRNIPLTLHIPSLVHNLFPFL